MTNTRKLPLEGVTVIDLGQVYQGPYAGFLMAQAGANVIKVEPPNGEPVRHRARISKGNAVPFAMLNANKRNISLNLKSAEGVKVLKELAARADSLRTGRRRRQRDERVAARERRIHAANEVRLLPTTVFNSARTRTAATLPLSCTRQTRDMRLSSATGAPAIGFVVRCVDAALSPHTRKLRSAHERVGVRGIVRGNRAVADRDDVRRDAQRSG